MNTQDALKVSAAADDVLNGTTERVDPVVNSNTLPVIPRGHFETVGDIQNAVGALLGHAVEQADLDIKDDFLKTIIPLLRRNSQEFSEQEEITLWGAYNQLSKLVYPVTVESLAIAGEIHDTGLEIWDSQHNDADGISRTVKKCRRELRLTLFITCVLVILFFFVQGYAIVVGETVKNLKETRDQYAKIQQRIIDIKSTNQSIQDNDPALRQVLADNQVIESKVKAMHNLPLVIGTSHCDGKLEYNGLLACVDRLARFQVLLLSTHVLPFVLGFLGAMAAQVRHSLDSLANKSFTQGWTGRLGLRLVLGGLLGEISGIIFAPSLDQLEALKLSLVFVAFLMGYSTDLAFAVFDRAITSVREGMRPKPKSSEPLRVPDGGGERIEP